MILLAEEMSGFAIVVVVVVQFLCPAENGLQNLAYCADDIRRRATSTSQTGSQIYAWCPWALFASAPNLAQRSWDG